MAMPSLKSIKTTILSLILLLIATPLLATASKIKSEPNPKADFWSTPRRGTNFFNQLETRSRLEAAKAIGIEFIRLAPNKWNTASRDFLLGDADDFNELVESDVASIVQILDEAERLGLKVVLTTLSAPGCRWAQQNGNRYDKRLWQDFKYHRQMAHFWEKLASRLKDHPAVVGYDVINEPAPERAVRFEDWYTGDYAQWYASVKDTPADINKLYRSIHTAIRRVDQKTPIIFETGFYATPWAVKYLEVIDDPAALYSVHMYEPFSYTSYEQSGEYIYPGIIPVGEGDKPVAVSWDRAQLTQFFEPLRQWQTQNRVASQRLLVGEFGVFRQHQGADLYLKDLIGVFKEAGWHWAFYSFREDTWPGMDYELGRQALSAEWWEAYERGENPPRPYVANPLFDAILDGIRSK